MVKQIYRFFDGLRINHRITAYYRSTGGVQSKRHGLDFDEIVGAYKILFEEWTASATATPVTPIDDFIQYAIEYLVRADRHVFDRSIDERVFIVDVNGDVFSAVESYEPEFCYGNLIQSTISEIAASKGRARSVALSHERTKRFCHRCPYFGACPGVFVANATNEECQLLLSGGCPVRALIDYIIKFFEHNDLTSSILQAHEEAGYHSQRHQ
jgi:uncharacterized protein